MLGSTRELYGSPVRICRVTSRPIDRLCWSASFIGPCGRLYWSVMAVGYGSQPSWTSIAMIPDNENEADNSCQRYSQREISAAPSETRQSLLGTPPR